MSLLLVGAAMVANGVSLITPVSGEMRARAANMRLGGPVLAASSAHMFCAYETIERQVCALNSCHPGSDSSAVFFGYRIITI